MKILASKQVGDISYFVESPAVLALILRDEVIRGSNSLEYNPKTGHRQRYISFSRNIFSAANRNNKRWRYGIILDGTKLSDKYSFEPYSYFGHELSRGKIRIKSLAEYDNDTFELEMVNIGPVAVNRQAYGEIRRRILDIPDDVLRRKNFTIIHGKRPYKGRTVVERLKFNTPVGYAISDDWLPDSAFNAIAKSDRLNEYEERIWLDNQSQISIKGCVKFVLVPRKESFDIIDGTEPQFELLSEVVDNMSIDIVEY